MLLFGAHILRHSKAQKIDSWFKSKLRFEIRHRTNLLMLYKAFLVEQMFVEPLVIKECSFFVWNTFIKSICF